MKLVKALCLAALLVVWSISASHAQQNFSMTGKYGRNTGPVIDIPAVGLSPCLSHTIGIDTAGMAMTTFPRVVAIPGVPANPGGCVPGAASKVAGTGSSPAGFSMPPSAFSQPQAVNTVLVPVAPNVVQLRTSFAVNGPLATPISLMGSMSGTFPNAAWRQFRASAWTTQTGRAGSNFTWCPGNPACTTYGQGLSPSPLIVKYRGGTNNFGGTMGLLLDPSLGLGNLALVGLAFLQPGQVGFQVLGGNGGSVFDGRGYAARRTAILAAGAVYNMYVLAMSSTSPGMTGFIKSVSTFVFPLPSGFQYQTAMPFTTGNVLARNVNTVLGAPNTQTVTMMGSDSRTALGAGNITLVAGGVGTTDSGNFTPNLDKMSLNFVPEPSSVLLLAAGGLYLIGIRRMRARR